MAIYPVQPVYAGLGPDQLVLVVNKAVPEGLKLADYYRERRHVPKENVIIVNTSRREEISRGEYERDIARPIRAFLQKNDPQARRYAALVLFYGMPLRIRPQAHDEAARRHIQELKERLAVLQTKLSGRAPDTSEAKVLKGEAARIEQELSQISRKHDGAAVDSETALVMDDQHALAGWLPNKYFIGFRGKGIPGMPRKVLPVCRLDGPSEDTVRRMLDDALFTEEHELAGRAYLDARWPDNGDKKSPYQIYDAAIHNTARILQKHARMPVILDEREALFGPGEAKDAALYLGWYSLAKYVDAFTWARGAVGYHVASAECASLKDANSQAWCRKMLGKGVAATLGPVAEPYLQSFPAPEVFFGALLQGGTLLESYVVSNPFWSWQMVLIGDPLYRPFPARQIQQ